MTIAICLKVGDGVVLGADSASTLATEQGVVNVYFNAEKIFNLRKGLPIGAVTYGLGGIGGRSVTSLAKDLRDRFTNPGPWHLDPQNYTMEEVATRLREFFYDEHYLSAYPDASDEDAPPSELPTPQEPPTPKVFHAMGFTVAGFSAGVAHPEVWSVEVHRDGKCPPPRLEWDREASGVLSWNGEPEAINRLMAGHTQGAVNRLMEAGVSAEDAFDLVVDFKQLAHAAMPVQDAIDLVEYLIHVTIGWIRFRPGASTVAPPIDLAAITLHERFRWVRRKHYYSVELNPPPLSPDPLSL